MLDRFRQWEVPMATVCWSRGQNLSKSYMFAERCHRARANHCFNDHHLSQKLVPQLVSIPAAFTTDIPSCRRFLFQLTSLWCPVLNMLMGPFIDPILYIHIYIIRSTIYTYIHHDYHILSRWYIHIYTIMMVYTIMIIYTWSMIVSYKHHGIYIRCFFGVFTIVQLCDLEHLANFYGSARLDPVWISTSARSGAVTTERGDDLSHEVNIEVPRQFHWRKGDLFIVNYVYLYI